MGSGVRSWQNLLATGGGGNSGNGLRGGVAPTTKFFSKKGTNMTNNGIPGIPVIPIKRGSTPKERSPCEGKKHTESAA